MKKQVIQSSVSLVLAIFTIAISQLAQIPAVLYLRDNQGQPFSVWQLLISLGLYWFAIGLGLWLALSLKLIKPKEKLSWKKLALFILVGEVAIWTVSFIGVLVSLMMGDNPLSTNQEAINDMMILMPKSILLSMLVVGAPVLEEVACRGFIPRIFSAKWQWLGFLLGAVIFGLLHTPATVGTAVQYIGMGLVLSAVAFFSKRLEYSILLHFLHNSLAFIILSMQM